ncbi:unnamed protein product [Cylindrotheca closterium]|uniref:Phosphoglycolate phosphatase n=1 Tax=Cylindrotheca closterium TaxID=2856 RepID=A0AAD2G0W6_9STRA|nr:unnamed protein product [Cylindrotheca closterium]
MHESTSTTSKTEILSGVRDIVDRYDVFLLDMWGVMHDGEVAYEGVLDVISKLKELGKDLIILSNSSKRQIKSIKMLNKLGFDPKDFSNIITSGEVAYHMLSNTKTDDSALAPQPWDVLEPFAHTDKKKVFCFGSGDGDEEYVTSCGWELASMEEADLIVARGYFTINDGTNIVHKNNDGEEAYLHALEEQIQQAAKRKIPMIVANPDKIRPDADRTPMPGTIGVAYESSLGGDANGLVRYIGKPFADVYEIALRGKDRARVCMVGDALETDITGAVVEGIDSIWVANDGIHNVDIEKKGDGSLEAGFEKVVQEFNQRKDTYAKGQQLSPDVVLPHFRW